MSRKQPLLSLPLAPSLPHYLTPDAVMPTAQALLHLCRYSGKEGEPMPSMLRRSRQIAHAHFAFVSPMPVEFPYRVPPAIVEDLQPGEDGIDIEQLLSKVEANLDHPVFSDSEGLNAYTSPIRDKLISQARLLGLSPACIRDLLPSLDVGDAFDAIASSSASTSNAAKQVTEVLSGRAVMTNKGAEKPFAPWSLVYGGHQFGQWRVPPSQATLI
jgi:hypothetical protein